MKFFSKITLMIITLSIALLAMSACSSSGGSGYSRTTIHHGVGYRGYRADPWGYRPVYIPIDGGSGVDPDWGVEAPSTPIAVPMPDMGMPDFGGMDFDF